MPIPDFGRFAEPAILSPKLITFSLDRDVDDFMGPFRIESRPVSVFDIISQGLRPQYPSGMMFLFGSRRDNGGWLLDARMRFTGNSMFRPWNYDKWIRRSKYPFWRTMLIDLGFDELKAMEEALDPRSSFTRREIEESTERQTAMNTVREMHRPWDDFAKHFEANFEKFGNRGDGEMKSYSTETTRTTYITRRADGSIHKETVTTECLADGSSKVTKIVDITPARGDTRQSKTETTITTTPPTEKNPFEDTKTMGTNDTSTPPLPQIEHSESRPEVEEKTNVERSVERDKGTGTGNDQRDWTWWYWSKK